MWIGEIDVTPGSYLNFHIGNGGSQQRIIHLMVIMGVIHILQIMQVLCLNLLQGEKGGKYSTSDNLSSFYGLGKGLNSAGSLMTGQESILQLLEVLED